ncbi:exodeoxyribonuclease VII small subunit [Slackia piriformis]|uniref:exodeoxyribonuclease VII small subunit n=1 Tax=Slackia piriformis TaxID=626934 RepID=UPI0026DAD8E7|nr:exodeoxyribonuclease VII small subunit [Slackia piriformis]MDO5024639.1 exodeoxyribonuclease VII small subunit [Slackia piriformis]
MNTDAANNVENKEMSFREAMAELDRTVAVLESNTLELEDSLKAYERGVAILSDLKQRLSSAQQKVDVLMGQLDAPADDATTDTTLS